MLWLSVLHRLNSASFRLCVCFLGLLKGNRLPPTQLGAELEQFRFSAWRPEVKAGSLPTEPTRKSRWTSREPKRITSAKTHPLSPPWNEGDSFTYSELELQPELERGRHNSPVTATEFPASFLCHPHGQPENPSQLPLLGRFTNIARGLGSRARGQDLPHEADDSPLPWQAVAGMSGRDGQIPKRPCVAASSP